MRKLILSVCCLTFTVNLATAQGVKSPEGQNAQSVIAPRTIRTMVVPANKAYAEPFTTGEVGVDIPVRWPETWDVVSRWTNAQRSVVWYLYQTKGYYDMFFDTQITKGKRLNFDLLLSRCDAFGFKPLTTKLTMEGKNESDTVFAQTFYIPQAGYYRYELKPITKPDNNISIRTLIFKSPGSTAQVNHTDYQSSPSVHLSFSTTAPTTKSYDWIYQEILVPKGGDPLATYYMSLGFYRGYMGIQTNSNTERRVLFSVWDSKDADKDATMTASDFVSLVDKDPMTTVNSFGNEGTGGQSYVSGANWKTGQAVKFLMNVRKVDGGTVLLSAWYRLAESDKWQYVATWRAPHESRMFDGFYSFIENYGYTNGQLPRKAYYYNAWAREDQSDKWVNLNKVRFSNTDGKVGQRVDYEQGVAPEMPDKFYMSSGGYTPTVKTANELPLSITPPNIDLTMFDKRIDEALSQEVKHKNAVKKEVRGKKK